MKTILVAAAELSSRFPKEKGGKPVRHIIKAGAPVTPALAKQFGLDADDIATLVTRGHIVERSAHVVAEGDGPSAADLAAAEQRAADAEAAVEKLAAELKEANAEGDDLTVKLEAARKLLTPEQIKTLDAPAKA